MKEKGQNQKVKDNSPHPKCLTSGGEYYVLERGLRCSG